MKPTKTRICEFCDACKRLYTIGRYRYWRERYYYCMVNDTITNKKGSCEMWKRKKTEYDLSEQRFDEVEKDVRLLIQYFKDSN